QHQRVLASEVGGAMDANRRRENVTRAHLYSPTHVRLAGRDRSVLDPAQKAALSEKKTRPSRSPSAATSRMRGLAYSTEAESRSLKATRRPRPAARSESRRGSPGSGSFC